MNDATSTSGAPPDGGALVEMRGVVKRFGSLVANDHVDLTLRRGEIHGLLGENGAGKSTLAGVLYGLHHPDGGTIHVHGEPVVIRSPRDAIALGIGLVHQELMLVPNLSVVENVIAGTSTSQVLDLAEASRRVHETAKRIGFSLDDASAPVRNLTVGEAQRVEIVKAIYRGARVLILDEPTSRLTPSEVEGFGRIIRTVRDNGGAVVLVTHKLEEVLQLCDRVTVLRNGRVVESADVHELVARSASPAADLARAMVGRPVLLEIDRPHAERGAVTLRLDGVTMEPRVDARALRDVNLELHAGEIVGLAGVAGNGQRELAEVIIGLRRPDSGTVELFGHDITHTSPRQRAEEGGIGFVPDDRKNGGIIPALNVAENVALRSLRVPPIRRWLFVMKRALMRLGSRLASDYDVRGGGPRQPISSLSGGNQQKALLARELHVEPAVLVVLQPTAGLDVGAIEAVHNRLLHARAAGTAILLVSNELSEILSLSDRVAVISGGRVTLPEPTERVDLAELGLAMAGVERRPAAATGAESADG